MSERDRRLIVLLVVFVTVVYNANSSKLGSTERSDDPVSQKTSLYDVDNDAKPDDLSKTNDDNEDQHLKGDDGDEIFLVPRTAKSFLRVRRWGFKIKRIWGEEQSEEREERENRNESIRRAEFERSCRSSCWGSWSGWSSCSTPCGSSGVQRSTRSTSPPSHCAGFIAQHGCPGPSVRSQPCGRSCHNGGSLRANDCACSAGWSGRCCEHRVTCGFPGKPSNGQVSPTGSTHIYGTVATFSCDTGYNRQGSATRTCQHNGQWSGSVATCQIVSCGDPGTPQHGSKQGGTHHFGSSVVFSCQGGYTLSGAASINCGANGGWSAPRPTCIPVTCPVLASIRGGSATYKSRNYQSVATYTCNSGYHLQGPATRTCQINGQWNGAQPTCSRITCQNLPAPQHGSVVPSFDPSGQVPHGSMARFSCNTGYILQGAVSRVCGGAEPTGTWSGVQTTCQPVDCGNPGVPLNGGKQGGVYTYGNRVTFQCQPGFKLSGSTAIQCEASGKWSASKPQCTGCPRNMYKMGLNSMQDCTSCPAHSHTVAEASASIQQCVCNIGYTGAPGGPCTEILCPDLTLSMNSRLISCDHHINGTCHLTCADGHVKNSGSESRQCRNDGTWSGNPLTCRACPKNAYKAGPSTCSPCPQNSFTQSIGSNLQECVCEIGYTGPAGGPCTDEDECSSTNRGRCMQACTNTLGSYRCSCNLPGFVQDAFNNTNCIARNQCPDLDAPENGGLVCVGETSTNTERCEIKCNPGFEHSVSLSGYEECGPSTNWQWSHQINDMPLLPCVEAYFAGVALEAEVAYFITDCTLLTDDIKQSISSQFITMLQLQGVCVNSGTATCNIDDVTIDCGAVVNDLWGSFRKRRSATQQNELRVKFKMARPEVRETDANCTEFCDGSQVTVQCLRLCEEQYQNTSNEALSQAANRLGQLFGTVRLATITTTSPPPLPTFQPGISSRRMVQSLQPAHVHTSNPLPLVPVVEEDNGLTLSCSGLMLVPKQGFRTNEQMIACGPGMVQRPNSATCTPCPPGSHLPPGSNRCVLCPYSTYQPQARQTQCLPCSHPTSATNRGARSCGHSQNAHIDIRHGSLLGFHSSIVDVSLNARRNEEQTNN